MAVEPPKQRLFRLLRRTAKGARTMGERTTADESALWSAHERALVRARDAGAAAQRIASNAARQRSSVDTVADRARAISSRAAEVQGTFTRVVDAFERLSLVALNAGLESARLGETEGRQLALVSDEVRSHASRGAESARDLSSALVQLAADLSQLEGHVAQAQLVVAEVTQDSARAAGAASDAEAALVDIGERVKKATGSDPETVRAIAEASERARALVTSLSALSGKVPRGLLVGALGPVLAPLARVLSDEEPDEDDRGEPT
ncbi:MAG TPA: methyl-accepting chemotaxis protein [Polyangiaceae bacterium]|jgi:methyl-accepting chemotaxis protein